MCWKGVGSTIHLNFYPISIPCLDMLTLPRLSFALVQMNFMIGMVLNTFSVTVDDLQIEGKWRVSR